MTKNIIDQATTAAIKECAHRTHAGKMNFPEVIKILTDIGIESYYADYRTYSTTYYFIKDDATLTCPFEPIADTVANEFNLQEIKAAIQLAQRGEIKYPEFIKLTLAAGCIGYMVWITGRHVTYFGRKGEMHVESFPLPA